jgi:hypothetical protein
VEVTGSNPVSPTRIIKGLQALKLVSPFFMGVCKAGCVWMLVMGAHMKPELGNWGFDGTFVVFL